MDNESPRQPYEIVSVKRADPPPGAEGSAWYRYVIAQGTNTIRGDRQGNLKSVTGAVKQIVTQLNERRSGKRNVTAHKVTVQKKAPKKKTRN